MRNEILLNNVFVGLYSLFFSHNYMSYTNNYIC